jgi:ubiquinone/menaquinone biosynthesis C-methylase UbiE
VETFWDRENDFDTFRDWFDFAGRDGIDLALMEVIEAGYQSILEVGPGVFTFYQMLRKELPEVKYTAADLAEIFVYHGKCMAANVVQADVEELPFEDSSFECGYTARTLLHCEGFHKGLDELIRVSQKGVLVEFAKLNAHRGKYKCFDEGLGIYKNAYRIKEISRHLRDHEKVESYHWLRKVAAKIVHIKLWD